MTEASLYLIRKTVFNIPQDEMASIAGVSQATVSRWESGELEPDRKQMDAIRAEAVKRKIKWRDDWFFDAAKIPQQASAA